MATTITWDAPGEHLFETGVDHGVLYVLNANTGVYGNGVAWNGLTGVTESPDGAEPTDLWADNIKYATLRSAETFGLTIEAYTNIVRNSVGSGAALSAILTVTSAVILIICLKISKGKIRV